MLACRLPGAAGAAGQQPWALRSLMTRITQQLRQVLGHSQQQGPGMPSADERPTKKQCTVAGKGAEVQDAMNCSPELKQHLVHLLVKAYQCVGCQPGRSNRTWQLEFCNLLQEVQQLHGPLLQQLLHSVQGRHADEGQSQVSMCFAQCAPHAMGLLYRSCGLPAAPPAAGNVCSLLDADICTIY